MPKELLYSPQGDLLKSNYVSLISGSDVPRVDRAIDIIYQTPDSVILPYLEAALKKNPTADPKKLVSAIANAESQIFKNFQAAPWDEVHHGRASLSSMRNVRYLNPEQRVLALNGIADAVGGPIGNSNFNLRGNSAARGAHTGGSVPWKSWEGFKYRDLYDLPSIGRENSMHPMGTDAARDPRGIVVPQVDRAGDFISRARDSIKIQFNDTVSGRYSDLPRRILVENMIQGAQRRRGDISTSTPLLYGNDANPDDVKASKAFLALPENENLRINMLKGAFHPDSLQGQAFLQRPKNAALADMYISQMYHGGIPINPNLMPKMKNLVGGAAGLTIADPDVMQSAARGDYTGAISAATTAAAASTVGQTVLNSVLKPTPIPSASMARLMPIAQRVAPFAGPVGAMTSLLGYTPAVLAEAHKKPEKTAKPSLLGSMGANLKNKPLPSKNRIDLANEAEYFIVNPIKNALKSVFGNREI